MVLCELAAHAVADQIGAAVTEVADDRFVRPHRGRHDRRRGIAVAAAAGRPKDRGIRVAHGLGERVARRAVARRREEARAELRQGRVRRDLAAARSADAVGDREKSDVALLAHEVAVLVPIPNAARIRPDSGRHWRQSFDFPAQSAPPTRNRRAVAPGWTTLPAGGSWRATLHGSPRASGSTCHGTGDRYPAAIRTLPASSTFFPTTFGARGAAADPLGGTVGRVSTARPWKDAKIASVAMRTATIARSAIVVSTRNSRRPPPRSGRVTGGKTPVASSRCEAASRSRANAPALAYRACGSRASAFATTRSISSLMPTRVERSDGARPSRRTRSRSSVSISAFGGWPARSS